jgi:hypothetical protein
MWEPQAQSTCLRQPSASLEDCCRLKRSAQPPTLPSPSVWQIRRLSWAPASCPPSAHPQVGKWGGQSRKSTSYLPVCHEKWCSTVMGRPGVVATLLEGGSGMVECRDLAVAALACLMDPGQPCVQACPSLMSICGLGRPPCLPGATSALCLRLPASLLNSLTWLGRLGE